MHASIPRHPVSAGALSRRATIFLPLAATCLMWGPARGTGLDVFAEGQVPRPGYVQALEARFGAPNRNGFGSTVLFGTAGNRADLTRLAQDAYRHFLGDLWNSWGEATWMGPWRLVFERTTSRDIIAELNALPDSQARSGADMMLNGTETPDLSKAALVEAFDDTSIEHLLVFSIGDGGAMSGILVAARRANGEATFLVFLMD